MERFEIALRLDDERILIPSMLPRERPSLLMEDSPGSQNGGSQRDRLSKLVSLPRGRAATERSLAIDHILRNYHLGYVPAGFWSRLIGKKITYHGGLEADSKESKTYLNRNFLLVSENIHE